MGCAQLAHLELSLTQKKQHAFFKHALFRWGFVYDVDSLGVCSHGENVEIERLFAHYLLMFYLAHPHS